MSVDYGTDTSCGESLVTGRLVTGVRLIAENARHRLDTPRGMLRGGEDEANYGVDLSAYIGATEPVKAEASLPGVIRNELTKDERILDVDTTVVRSVDGPETTFTLTINARTSEGPFLLVLAVSAVTNALLKLEAG